MIRLGGGFFHDGTGGVTFKGGPAYLYNKEILYTDMNTYLATNIATALVPNTSGVLRADPKRPNNIRFSGAIQREIGFKVVLDVAYVGTRSKYLSENWDINMLPAGVRFLPQNRDTTVAASALNPGAMPDAFLRPIVGFNNISIAQPTGYSQYDSVQTQLTRRFTGNFEMAGSYTWAKGAQRTLRQNNPLPSTYDRSDIPEHVLVMSYMYTVPGAGRFNGVAKTILGDWKISGISTFATGGRGNVSVSYAPAFDNSGGGETCGNYNIVGDIELPRGERTIDRWFNTAAVKPVTTIGDLGNGCNPWKFRLPGFNHDLTLFKNFTMKGKQTLQYRWEIYNLMNSVSFMTVNTAAVFNPNTGAQTNSNFGKVTAARTERRMQMALRYSF